MATLHGTCAILLIQPFASDCSTCSPVLQPQDIARQCASCGSGLHASFMALVTRIVNPSARRNAGIPAACLKQMIGLPSASYCRAWPILRHIATHAGTTD